MLNRTEPNQQVATEMATYFLKRLPTAIKEKEEEEDKAEKTKQKRICCHYLMIALIATTLRQWV